MCGHLVLHLWRSPPLPLPRERSVTSLDLFLFLFARDLSPLLLSRDATTMLYRPSNVMTAAAAAAKKEEEDKWKAEEERGGGGTTLIIYHPTKTTPTATSSPPPLALPFPSITLSSLCFGMCYLLSLHRMGTRERKRRRRRILSAGEGGRRRLRLLPVFPLSRLSLLSPEGTLTFAPRERERERR